MGGEVVMFADAIAMRWSIMEEVQPFASLACIALSLRASVPASWVEFFFLKT